jgi:hypothetical protein
LQAFIKSYLNKLIIPNNEYVKLTNMFAYSKIKSSIYDWDISKVKLIPGLCYNTKIKLPLLINKEFL